MRVAVLGATGQAGRLVSRLLMEGSAIDLVACGRSAGRLGELQSTLPVGSSSLTTSAFDLNNDARLDAVLESVDVVVGATSSWRDGPRIAAHAVRASASYLGIYLSNRDKWAALRGLHNEALRHRVAVVDDGGVHPGLPGAMIRRVGADSPLTSAWVGGKFALKWSDLDLAPETVLDFAEELRTMDPALHVDGERVTGYRHARRFDFGDGDGPVSCVPMALEEVRELAESADGPASLGFFIAGFGPWVDYVVMPAALVLGRVRPGAASRSLLWGLRRFASSENPGAVVLLQATTREGREVGLRVSHPDPYALTAIPVVAAVRQLLSDPEPGVWTQAAFVEPHSFFKDMASMGVAVEFAADSQ